MNQYARLALEHNRRHRPTEFEQIADPMAFFSAAGEEIQDEVTELRDKILGPRRRTESIDHYRLRGYQALATARETLLAEHPLFQIEQESEDNQQDPDLVEYFAQLAMVTEAIHVAL